MEINAQGLEIGYGEFVAVENMDITVKKGEITTIIGPNGSGKSTVFQKPSPACSSTAKGWCT